MEQQELFEKITAEDASRLTFDEQIKFIELQQDIIKQQRKEISRLIKLYESKGEQTLLLDNQYILLKNKVFGRSSEKSNIKKEKKKEKGTKRKRVLLPSERYPNIPIKEEELTFIEPPKCKTCGNQMKDTGLIEVSEHLTVIPAKYMVVRQKKHKYGCQCCYGDLKTTPVPPRIKPGSSYSDEMIIDVAMSKYCDLIPIERYCAIASRKGIKDLPPHSLIELTHYLADYGEKAALKCKKMVQNANELHGDETPHRQLDKKSKGYLWGFSSDKSCYFEIHSGRAGDIAANFLKDCKCNFLVSDAYSGYAKAVRIANEKRKELKINEIKNIYCNAHCRRKFKDSERLGNNDAKYFVKCYKKIYKLQSRAPTPKFPLEQIRIWQKIYFTLMQRRAEYLQFDYSKKSTFGGALRYLLKFYKELTLFMDFNLSIDNNSQERLLRNPVIGRKTWFGTNSPRGAKTATILFTLVESCRINNVNPREYFKDLVQEIHAGRPAITPFEFSRK